MFAGIQTPFTVMDKNSQNPPSILENENLKLQLLLDNYVSLKDEYNKSRTWVSKIAIIITKANKLRHN